MRPSGEPRHQIEHTALSFFCHETASAIRSAPNRSYRPLEIAVAAASVPVKIMDGSSRSDGAALAVRTRPIAARRRWDHVVRGWSFTPWLGMTASSPRQRMLRSHGRRSQVRVRNAADDAWRPPALPDRSRPRLHFGTRVVTSRRRGQAGWSCPPIGVDTPPPSDARGTPHRAASDGRHSFSVQDVGDRLEHHALSTHPLDAVAERGQVVDGRPVAVPAPRLRLLQPSTRPLRQPLASQSPMAASVRAVRLPSGSVV